MDNNQFAAFSFSGSTRKASGRAKSSKGSSNFRHISKNAGRNSTVKTVTRFMKDGIREDEQKNVITDTLGSDGSASASSVQVGGHDCKDDPFEMPSKQVVSVTVEKAGICWSRKDESARVLLPEAAATEMEEFEEDEPAVDANTFNSDKPNSSALPLGSTERTMTDNENTGTEESQKVSTRDGPHPSPLPIPVPTAFTKRSNSRNGTSSAFCDDIEDYRAEPLSCPVAAVDKLVAKKLTSLKRTFNEKVPGWSITSSPPVGWTRALHEIRIMRTGQDAPVDLHGPQQLVDESADPQTQKFHILVAAMISSQTRDSVTAAAMKRLHAAPGGVTVQHIAGRDVSVESLEELLKPVLYYRQKAKHLKTIAEILSRPPYCGCVPSSFDELIKLPGVGPKVGLVVLWVAFGMGEVGLIADTNVRRVSCRLGWAPEGSTADQVRTVLEKWLPRDLWAEISFLFAGFGQQVCKPIGPKCNDCGLKDICPSAFKCGKVDKKRCTSDRRQSDASAERSQSTVV